MTKSSSTCIFNFAVTLIVLTISSANAQDYFSSISKMKTLPPLLEDIANQLGNIMVQIRTDLRVINETRDRLKEIKIKPKNKIDTFVLMNKMISLKKHLTRRYNLITDPTDFPQREDVMGTLFSLSVLRSTYNLKINDICKGYIRQEYTNIDLFNKLIIIHSYYRSHESHVHPIKVLHETIHSINKKVSKNHLHKDVQTKKSWTIIADLYKAISDMLLDKHRSYVIKLFHYILEYLSKECETFSTIFIGANMGFIRPNLGEILNHTGDLRELEKEFRNVPPSRWNPYVDEDMSLKEFDYYSQLCQGKTLFVLP